MLELMLEPLGIMELRESIFRHRHRQTICSAATSLLWHQLQMILYMKFFGVDSLYA